MCSSDLVFKKNVYLDNIIDNELNPDKNWQGLKFENDFEIGNISGLSNIGGVDEIITIDQTTKVNDIKLNYENLYKKLLNKLYWNNNKTNDKIHYDKYNKSTLFFQNIANFNKSKISNLSLIGSTKTLQIIQKILNQSGHVESINLTLIDEVKKQF